MLVVLVPAVVVVVVVVVVVMSTFPVSAILDYDVWARMVVISATSCEREHQ
jgi:hypothetical protein